MCKRKKLDVFDAFGHVRNVNHVADFNVTQSAQNETLLFLAVKEFQGLLSKKQKKCCRGRFETSTFH